MSRRRVLNNLDCIHSSRHLCFIQTAAANSIYNSCSLSLHVHCIPSIRIRQRASYSCLCSTDGRRQFACLRQTAHVYWCADHRRRMMSVVAATDGSIRWCRYGFIEIFCVNILWFIKWVGECYVWHEWMITEAQLRFVLKHFVKNMYSVWDLNFFQIINRKYAIYY